MGKLISKLNIGGEELIISDEALTERVTELEESISGTSSSDVDVKKSMLQFFKKIGESDSNLKPITDSVRESMIDLRTFGSLGTGLFIHWGVYSVPAGRFSGVNAKGVEVENANISYNTEWSLRDLSIPLDTYKQYETSFTGTAWDADEIARMASEAGMGYIVITAKHHEGFVLYPSTYSDWDIRTSGCRWTVLDELKEACNKYGLKFGLYVSQYWDWMAEGGFGLNYNGKWNGSTVDLYTESQHLAYCNKAVLQINEMIERYNPFLLWYDPGTAIDDKYQKIFRDAEYENYIHVITNDRLQYNRAYGDFGTGERTICLRNTKYAEACFTMNDTWGYSVNNDNKYYTVEKVFKQFILYSLCYGQNCLMNIGPKPDGSVPTQQIDCLTAIKNFVESYGGFKNYKRVCKSFMPKWGYAIELEGNKVLCYVLAKGNTGYSDVVIDCLNTEGITSVDILTPGTNSTYTIQGNKILVSGLGLDNTTKVGVIRVNYSVDPILPDANYLSAGNILPSRAFPVKSNMSYDFTNYVYKLIPSKSTQCTTEFIWEGERTESHTVEIIRTTTTLDDTVTVTILDMDTETSSNFSFSNTQTVSGGVIDLVPGHRYKVTYVVSGASSSAVHTFEGLKFNVVSVVRPIYVGLNVNELTIAAGDTYQLVATVLPEDASNKDVTWSSSHNVVATVSSTGLVTANYPGVTTITVTTVDGELTDTCDIVVTGTETYDYLFEANSLDGSSTQGDDTGIKLFSNELQNWTLFGYVQNSVNPCADKNSTLYQCVVNSSPWTGLRVDANNNAVPITSTNPAPMRFRFLVGTDNYVNATTGQLMASSIVEDATTKKHPLCITRNGNVYKFSADGYNWTEFTGITTAQLNRLVNCPLTIGFDYKRSSGTMTTEKYRFLKTNDPCCVALKNVTEYPFSGLYNKYYNNNNE